MSTLSSSNIRTFVYIFQNHLIVVFPLAHVDQLSTIDSFAEFQTFLLYVLAGQVSKTLLKTKKKREAKRQAKLQQQQQQPSAESSVTHVSLNNDHSNATSNGNVLRNAASAVSNNKAAVIAPAGGANQPENAAAKVKKIKSVS